jgi:citrate synthase
MARSALAEFRRSGAAWWETAISRNEPNVIEIRGYAIQELIGELTFTELIALLVIGRRLAEPERRLLDAALVAGADHGPLAPSIAAARMAATCGVTFNSAVATGINMLGDNHGGAVEGFMDVVAGLEEVDDLSECCARVVRAFRARHEPVPGFGHQLHDRDPRRDRMVELLEEAKAAGAIRGSHLRGAIALEAALAREVGRELPMNVDGLTGIVYLELGFPPAVAKGLFSLSRGAGIVAHALEERLGGVRIKGPCPPAEGLVRYVGEPSRSLRGAAGAFEREFWSTFGEAGICVFWGVSREGLQALDPPTRGRLVAFTQQLASGPEGRREALLSEVDGLPDGERADVLRRLVSV